ncbi:MAG TPA: WbqC family protein [Terriglobales bacterium]
MIVSIHQPAYLPWLGYFDRLVASDAHVVLDHVQFEKNSFINRNKIRTRQGWGWLTLPIRTAGRFGDLPINQVEIANETPWASKHWTALRMNYGKSPFFPEHADFFRTIYERRWNKLVDLTREITDYVVEAFRITTPRYFSSELNVGGKKDELVLNICRQLGAKVYLSGPMGRNYLREEMFQDAGIAIRYHDYSHPTYPQTYPGFEPYMAAVDLLFNMGKRSLETLSPSRELIAR